MNSQFISTDSMIVPPETERTVPALPPASGLKQGRTSGCTSNQNANRTPTEAPPRYEDYTRQPGYGYNQSSGLVDVNLSAHQQLELRVDKPPIDISTVKDGAKWAMCCCLPVGWLAYKKAKSALQDQEAGYNELAQEKAESAGRINFGAICLGSLLWGFIVVPAIVIVAILKSEGFF